MDGVVRMNYRDYCSEKQSVSGTSILRGDVSQYIPEKKGFLELREEGIGIYGQLACLQSSWSVLNSLWALASDLLFRLLASWWLASPDSLIHSVELLASASSGMAFSISG